MNELVELLNEYHFSWTEYIWYYLDEKENRIYFRTKVVDKWLVDEQRISDERIISKKFGFIKWLVDNDKIDLRKLRKPKREFWNYMEILLLNKSTRDSGLLMLLAIQDEPIEFLCSILK